jgi:uridine phosphorylase
MEELIARGARRFVSVGIAGCLQARLKVGTTVLCSRAIRDEGTSYHYVRSSKYAYPSALLSARLRRGLEARGMRVSTGASWTVDAVYRETLTEVRTYREGGVLTVDMESSALFSIARAAGLEAAALFTVSDILHETGWEPRFVEAQAHLRSLLKETVAVLGARPTP